jgi:hypothetical protein
MGGTFDAVQESQRKAVEERIAAASSGKSLEDLSYDKMQQIRSFYTQVCFRLSSQAILSRAPKYFWLRTSRS